MILQGNSPGSPTLGSGLPGRKGDKGDKGDTGDQGLKGDTGDRGIQGNAGTAGKTAYQVAVDNGYSGSQFAWLASLVGQQGVKGDQGIQGIKGDQGVKGDGILINQRVANYAALPVDKGPEDEGWSVWVQNEGALYVWDGTSFPAEGDGAVLQGEQGIQGETGDAGEDGSDGAPGDSAYEIAVSNGFSGTEAEWLDSLVGDQGIQGEQGETGETGETGDAGTTTWAGIEDRPENLVTGYANGSPFAWKVDVLTEDQYSEIDVPDPATVYFRLGT